MRRLLSLPHPALLNQCNTQVKDSSTSNPVLQLCKSPRRHCQNYPPSSSHCYQKDPSKVSNSMDKHAANPTPAPRRIPPAPMNSGTSRRPTLPTSRNLQIPSPAGNPWIPPADNTPRRMPPLGLPKNACDPTKKVAKSWKARWMPSSIFFPPKAYR